METVIIILNGTVILNLMFLSFSQGTASIFFSYITLEMFIVLAEPVGDCRGYGGRILLLI